MGKELMWWENRSGYNFQLLIRIVTDLAACFYAILILDPASGWRRALRMPVGKTQIQAVMGGHN